MSCRPLKTYRALLGSFGSVTSRTVSWRAPRWPQATLVHLGLHFCHHAAKHMLGNNVRLSRSSQPRELLLGGILMAIITACQSPGSTSVLMLRCITCSWVQRKPNSMPAPLCAANR